MSPRWLRFTGLILIVEAIGGADARAAASLAERFVAISVVETPTRDADVPGAAIRGRQQRLLAGFGSRPFAGGELAIGLDYAYDRFEYERIPSRDRDLHRLTLPLVWRRERDRSAVQLALRPTVATSSNVFKELWADGSGEDYYLGGRLTVEYPHGDWVWHVGVAADRAFGASSWYPVVGAEREIGARWHLRLVLPEPAVRYRVGDRQEWSLGARPAGHRWHVVSDDFSADFDYRLRALSVEVSWRYRVSDRWSIGLMAGYESATEHRFADDRNTPVDLSLEDGLTYGLALRMRY